MAKLKRKIANWLLGLVGRLFKPNNQKEHKERLDAIRSFLHTDMPTFWPKFQSVTIIEGGRYNYFQLPNGDLPLIDFVIPEISLFVCVGDIRSASWPESRSRGIDRWSWDEYQTSLAVLQEELPNMATIGRPVPIYFLFIGWNDPVDPYSLKQRLVRVFDNAIDS